MRCPVCEKSAEQKGQWWVCPNGHHFNPTTRLAFKTYNEDQKVLIRKEDND